MSAACRLATRGTSLSTLVAESLLGCNRTDRYGSPVSGRHPSASALPLSAVVVATGGSGNADVSVTGRLPCTPCALSPLLTGSRSLVDVVLDRRRVEMERLCCLLAAVSNVVRRGVRACSGGVLPGLVSVSDLPMVLLLREPMDMNRRKRVELGSLCLIATCS